jgi:hypothetical protein
LPPVHVRDPLQRASRPLLTRSIILILSMGLLAAASLAFVAGGSEARMEVRASDRPHFTRRIATLPAVVVTVAER